MIVNTRNEFISYLQTKFSQEVAEMSESRTFIYDSEDFYLIREMSETIDFFANSRYNYVDDNLVPTYADTCKFDTDKIDRIIDFYKQRYRLDNLPYIDYPHRTTKIVHDIFCGGNNLPPGGGVDYFLTKDSTGKLIWRKINTYLYKQFFLYTEGLYQFKLNIVPDRIYQVFVNGQLILEDKDYTLNHDTVTITSPNILHSGDEVKIYAGYRTLVLSDIGTGFNTIRNKDGVVQFTSTSNASILFEGTNGVDISFDGIANKIIISAGSLLDSLLYEEEFVWAGVNNQFSLLNPASSIFMVFINGQKISKNDFVHTSGTNIVTLNDELDSDDEIDIIYKIES